MTGFVYAFVVGKTVKIGWSKDPKKRFIQSKIYSAAPMRLAGYVPMPKEGESEMHRKFSSYWLRGEWFALKGEVAQFVRSLPNVAVVKPSPAKAAIPASKPPPFKPEPCPITGAQIHAARKLLHWSARVLAEESGSSLSTIQRLEIEERATMPTIRKAVVAALEAHRIDFTPKGPVLVLVQTKSPRKPIESSASPR